MNPKVENIYGSGSDDEVEEKEIPDLGEAPDIFSDDELEVSR
jgi:hypothetical protein